MPVFHIRTRLSHPNIAANPKQTAVILPFVGNKSNTSSAKLQSTKRRPRRKLIWQLPVFVSPGLESPAATLKQATNYHLCACLVANCFHLERHHIFSSTRVSKPYSFARHLALYLLAICFDLSCFKLMQITGRSHKTCSAALALIEDTRDDRRLDYLLTRLEAGLYSHTIMVARFEALASLINTAPADPRPIGAMAAQSILPQRPSG